MVVISWCLRLSPLLSVHVCRRAVSFFHFSFFLPTVCEGGALCLLRASPFDDGVGSVLL